MSITYKDIEDARYEANRQINLADMATRQAANLCVERLRAANVSTSTLQCLKKELKDFNAKTGEWK
jgi:hypothetical protein